MDEVWKDPYRREKIKVKEAVFAPAGGYFSIRLNGCYQAGHNFFGDRFTIKFANARVIFHPVLIIFID